MSENNDSAVSESDSWAQLDSELQAWAAIHRTASFWWRDDDAIAPTPALDKLINLSSPAGLLLAVIPAKLDTALVSVLAHAPHVHVAQHGYAHTNHAPRGQGQGAWELGLHRGIPAVMADIDAGRACLEEAFASTLLPVIVPPWNHISPELLEPLAARGYRGVSAFGPRATINRVQGLTVVNAHCDPIRWKSGPRFRGVTKTIRQLLEHLQARRIGEVDAAEPTGLLTHHLDLDAQGWEFCTRLANMIEQHAAAQWCSPKDLFAQQHE